MINRIFKYLFSKRQSGFNDTVRLEGVVHYVLKDMYGKVKEERLIKNTIPDAGKALLAALMITDVGAAGVDYIALGVGTPSATALGSESSTNGGARRGGADVTGSLTTTTTTNDTAQFTTTFTFTGNLGLYEEGLFTAAVGTMLASQTFEILNVVSGDTLAITHKIKCA